MSTQEFPLGVDPSNYRKVRALNDHHIPSADVELGYRHYAIAKLNNEMRNFLQNHMLASALLDQGSNTKKYKTTNTVAVLNEGAIASMTATDDIAQPLTTTGVGEFCKELVTWDGSAFQQYAGPLAVSQAAAVAPECPADEVPVGWIEIPASFTPGATDVTTGMCKNGYKFYWKNIDETELEEA